jgi:hypothetical protein
MMCVVGLSSPSTMNVRKTFVETQEKGGGNTENHLTEIVCKDVN